MSEHVKQNLFQVAPVSVSPANDAAGSLKAWATPRVITSTVESNTAAASAASNDGGASSHGS